jgi:hypothetical protein
MPPYRLLKILICFVESVKLRAQLTDWQLINIHGLRFRMANTAAAAWQSIKSLIIHKGQKCGVSRLHAVLVFPFSLSPARPFSAKQILNGKRRNLKKI